MTTLLDLQQAKDNLSPDHYWKFYFHRLVEFYKEYSKMTIDYARTVAPLYLMGDKGFNDIMEHAIELAGANMVSYPIEWINWAKYMLRRELKKI